MGSEIEIRRLVVVNREDAKPPSTLTLSHKGWWHLTKLHVPLALVAWRRAAGKVTLQQEFPRGHGPRVAVKGRGRMLQLRLYAGRRLRTQREVTVGDFVPRFSECVAEVAFDYKEDGKVQSAFLEVEAITPPPAPPLPPECSVRFYPPNNPAPLVTFPPPSDPSPARIKELVEAMYGPPTDHTDWSKPFTFPPDH